ncbi:hypothetical protein FHS39_002605 [Streptomyces olivoverticillatus]|uniref:Holin n=1 Tax=Streptomyces olivoverticillatus TaxID=66427 RepID=A0A7W7LNM6_9ACTN|nr:hypothetical protein [Streptomyces olivoverticillatus]MBB4893574.1 hypothetical protein [Streptomyces olivoverticillatus]
MRILGREPALWLGLLSVLVKLSTAFGLPISADQQAVVNAVAAAAVGVAVAVVAHDGISAAVLGFVQAAIALAVGLGLHWSPAQQAVVMSAAAAVVAMFVRTQVTAPAPAVARPLSRPVSSI